LPKELYGLAVPGDRLLVLDSETGQKDKQSLKLMAHMTKLLSSVDPALGQDYSLLSQEYKKTMNADVKTLLDHCHANGVGNVTLKALVTATIQGLTWKVAHVSDEKGQNGILTANHLGVQTDTSLFSRSARFNSTAKMTAVLESAAWQEYQKLTCVLDQTPLPTIQWCGSTVDMYDLVAAFKSDTPITKEAAQQLNTFFRDQGVHLYIETSGYSDPPTETHAPGLVMTTNLISAMDSEKRGEEVPHWASLTAAHVAIVSAPLTFIDSITNRTIRIASPLLTESSQSSFAGGLLALKSHVTTKIAKRNAQLADRLQLLRNQLDILGDGCKFTTNFKLIF
jgi:hypothetical protein